MLGQPVYYAHPRRDRLEAARQPARRHHRHRPGADGHRDAAPREGGGQVRRVLRRGRGQPVGDRPRHHRQHGARVRRDHAASSRWTRRPSTTCAPPVATRRECALVEDYFRAQGLFGVPRAGEIDYTARWSSISPASSLRSPAPSARRTASRLPAMRNAFEHLFSAPVSENGFGREAGQLDDRFATAREDVDLGHGDVLIAAITSCTNTSNPAVMIAAGLLAQKAVARGLTREAADQDLARARLAGGHRLPRQGRPARAARHARLRPRRLRLHHLHRQRRRPRARVQRGDRRARSGGGRGAVGQPQLRGPHPPQRPRQLPRLAAAGGGLRARRAG